MDAIRRLEARVEEWLSPLPHLPIEWRKWLADNIWWFTLIGLILSILSIFANIAFILTALGVFGPAEDIYGVYGVGVYQPPGGWFIFVQVVTVILLLANAVAMGLAIKPLREKMRIGWELVLLALVISTISSVVTLVLSIGTINFVPSLVGTAVGITAAGYLLFEVRHSFENA